MTIGLYYRLNKVEVNGTCSGMARVNDVSHKFPAIHTFILEGNEPSFFYTVFPSILTH